MKSTYAGPRGCFGAGTVADLPRAEAYALCEGGYAEQVEAEVEATPKAAPAEVETATTPETEKAVTRTAGPKRKPAPKRRGKK